MSYRTYILGVISAFWLAAGMHGRVIPSVAGTSPASSEASTLIAGPLGKAESTTLLALRTPTPSQEAPWGWLPPARETSLPDFEQSAEGSRGSSERVAAFREAAVILGTSDGGFGSGVLIGSEGWILTNYHVVAQDAQKSAITGAAPRLRVFLGQSVEGRMRARPEIRFAEVYRADPVHDLALVKLEGSLPPSATVRLAEESPPIGTECFAIGAQGSGFPWLLRSGKVLGHFDYPLGITDMVIAADSAGANLERTRLSILVSDCAISPGDSGGPLLDEAGRLIGLTFATPANLSGGSLGLHVDREEIARFLQTLPKEPEGVPFDPWVAGLPFSAPTLPRAGILREEGRPFFVLQMLHLGPSHQPLAELLFFDFEAQNPIQVAGTDTLMSLVPAGLWGMETRGGFTYDVFMVRRFDNLLAVGFPDASHVVSEIRIDSDGDQTSDVVWLRSKTGTWSAHAEARPLLDAARLEARGLRLLDQALHPTPGK